MSSSHDDIEAGKQRPHFATTQWSLVAAAAEPAAGSGRAALEQLCQQYWQPLYAWLRQSGSSHEDAEDLVQSFLLDTIDSGRVERADPSRGRFRTFLLASLKHYRANWRRGEQTLKRGGGVERWSLDFAQAGKSWPGEPSDRETPDRQFDRKWALCLIENSLQRVAAKSEAKGRGDLFARLKPYLTGADDADSHERVASELGLTVGAVRVALHRWREEWRRAIREEIRQTVLEEAEIEDELAHLMSVLGG
ncbi:MAG: RNA polymerase sigma factor [Planctomycetota bacterium]